MRHGEHMRLSTRKTGMPGTSNTSKQRLPPPFVQPRADWRLGAREAAPSVHDQCVHTALQPADDILLARVNAGRWRGLTALPHLGRRENTITLQGALNTTLGRTHPSCPVTGNFQYCTNGHGPCDPRFLDAGEAGTFMIYNDNRCVNRPAGLGVLEPGGVLFLIVVAQRVLPTLGPSVPLSLLPSGPFTGLARCEKNWVPFVIAGQPFVAYQLFPLHLVFALDLSTGNGTLVGAQAAPNRTVDGQSLQFFRGGTNAVEWRHGYMLALGHLKTPGRLNFHGRTDKFYRSAWYTFRARPPFAMNAVSVPFKLAEVGIEFPTILERLPGGVRVWYGCGDRSARAVLLTEGSIAAMLDGQMDASEATKSTPAASGGGPAPLSLRRLIENEKTSASRPISMTTTKPRPSHAREGRQRPSDHEIGMQRPSDHEIGIASFFMLPTLPKIPSRQCAQGASLDAECLAALKADVFTQSQANHQAYAQARGYTFLSVDVCSAAAQLDPGNISRVTPASWAKIHLVRACMLGFPLLRYVLWIDADAIFLDLGVSIQSRLLTPAPGPQCSLMVAEDVGGQPFNMGIFLVRNDRAAEIILERLMMMSTQPEFRFRRYWEQDGLRWLWSRNDSADAASAAAGARVCIVRPRRAMQSLVKVREVQPGDFIAHYTWVTRRGFLQFNETVHRVGASYLEAGLT